MADCTPYLSRARDATGLNDFGSETFREGLEIYLQALADEARLTPAGRSALEAQIVDLLSWRLKIEECYRRHPEIEAQQIVAPLIGLGLPRTGSTAFSCLLAADPEIRFLRNWEAMMPCPPPDAATEADDPRLARAEAAMAARNQKFPRMRMMLPSTATSPTECQMFMAYDFKSQLLQACAQVPSYSDWLTHRADLVPTYRYVKRVLKLLQWRRPPGRWRLKNPSHIMFIGALDEVFPDARFWMTHRDVAAVIPSCADLYCELARGFSDAVDPLYMGRLNAQGWETGLRRLLAFRDAGNEHRFCDISFAALQRDPYPSLERLYRFLGEDFSAPARAAMQRWRQDTPREKHGAHTYDIREFGLDRADLRAGFAFYLARFGIEREDQKNGD